MTEKELRRLSRADLLEMLIDQGVELRKTQKRLKAARNELKSRRIAIDEAGSIAEAALQINGIFEAAQASCEQYMENIRTLSDRQEAVCKRREEESIQSANVRLAETERRCAALEAQTKEKCEKMVAEAKAESSAYWDDVSRKLKAFCSEHAEVRDLLSFSKMNR